MRNQFRSDMAMSLRITIIATYCKRRNHTYFKGHFLSHLSWQQQTDIKSFTNSLSIREFHSLAP